MKILTNLDFNLNEIRNVKVHILAADPSSPQEGQLWYNSTTGKLKYRNGSVVRDLTDALTLGGLTIPQILANTALTGVPTAPTAAVGTNTNQIATTAFTIAEIAARIASNDAMRYIGAIDASTNPNYPAADAGDTFRISIAGKIGGASGKPVEVGDMIVCHVDGSVAGTQAAVGANWDIIQTNIDGAVTVDAVQTLTNKTLNSPVITSPTGIVKGDVGLGNVDNTSDANKPISTATQTALNGKVTANGAITPSTRTKITYDSKGLVTGGTDATTSDIGEGSNLYFTDERAQDAVSTMIGNGTHTGISVTYDDAANSLSFATVGAIGKYSATIGNGSSITFTIPRTTHGRAADSTNIVQVMDATTGEIVYADTTVNPSNGDVTISFAVAPTTNQYRVVIMG